MSDPMSAVYEKQYGPVADKYASKYGIPTDIFRGVISSVSGFNPYKVNPDGSGGMAGLKQDGFKNLDIYNPSSSLEVAGAAIADLYKNEAGNSWERAAEMFKGKTVNVSDSGDMPMTDAMGNPTGQSVKEYEANDKTTANGDRSKPFWQYTSDDFKTFFQKSIYGLLLGIIGVVFIFGSIFMLFRAKSQ